MLFPSEVVSIAQVISELSDSNFAPSGMETEVYGIFVTQALFVSRTSGTGIEIPSAQAAAKGSGDAIDSVGGTEVNVGFSVGISFGVEVKTTAVNVGVDVASGWTNN